MQTHKPNLVGQLESLAGVDNAEAYPADYDLSSPDLIVVSGGVEDEIQETIEEALNDGEALLVKTTGGYMVYSSLGSVDEHDGSKFDILAYNDSTIEAVLVERAPHETAPAGTVCYFDRGDTDYDVTIDDNE